MARNRPRDGGQSHARSRELILAMQALKGREQLAGMRQIPAVPVVADKEGCFPFDPRCAELDPRLLLAGRVLPGIAEQILQQRAKQDRVADGAQLGAR